MPLSRRRFLAATAALSAAPLAGRLFAKRAAPPPNPVPAANTAFGCDLFAELRAKKGNVFFSPFSIETALAMTAGGAAGDTLTEMNKVLHLPDDRTKTDAGFKRLLDVLNSDGKDRERGYELKVANALWGAKNYPWKDAFLKASAATFGGGLTPVDFADEPTARKTINGWVEDNTAKRIKDLIPSGVLTADTRMVLTNAVYFKGQWAEEFDKKLTKDGPFTGADGKKADVPLMHRTADLRFAETDDVQAVELTYKGNETAMLVLLPKKADGLADAEKGLTADAVGKMTRSLGKRKVILTLPRFKIEDEYALKDPLDKLGMKDAFDPAKADFSGMTSGEKLFISAVRHKAFVEVNEEGTEAAAATSVEVAATSAVVDPPKPVVFKADRPFLFLIRHTPTDTVLFLGRCEKP